MPERLELIPFFIIFRHSAMSRLTLFLLIPSLAFAVAPSDDAPITLDPVEVTGSPLRASSLPLDDVNHTGSRLGLSTRELPASVSVVTQDFIQLRGARTAVEAVENAVGMTGGTSVGSIPTFATRGFTGNDITVMRDGIRQNTNSQAARPLDAFLFDRVEVLKGPASLLYGEGAIGGAVNYVSKLPTATTQGETLLSASAWDTYRTAVGIGGPLGQADSPFGYRADFSRQSTNGFVDRNASELHAFAGALRWTISPTASLTLQGTYLTDETESYYGTPVVYDAVIKPSGAQVVGPVVTATDRLVNPRIAPGTRRNNYNITDNFAEAQNAFARLIFDAAPAPDFSVRNEAYVATQDFNWRNVESYTFNPATGLVNRGSFLLIYRDDVVLGNRLDFTFDHDLAGRPNRFVIGGLVERADQIRNSGQPGVISAAPAVSLLNPVGGVGQAITYQKTANIIVDTAAIYAENVFTLNDHFKLIGGLRYEYINTERLSYLGAAPFEKTYRPLTGRLGAVWAINPAFSTYGSYSYAAQPVSQLVSLNAAQNAFTLQTGRQFEVGIKSSHFNDRLSTTLAVFDIEKNDLLTQTLVGGVQTAQQIGAQVSQGAEFAVAIAPTRDWRIDANVAYTWLTEFRDFNENLGGGVISREGNRPPNIPTIVANAFVVRTLGAWQLSGGVRHVGERFANNNNGITLDAYTTFDSAVSYTYRAATITLRGRNLTDRTYADWAVNGGAMQHLADPRSAELSVKYAF